MDDEIYPKEWYDKLEELEKWIEVFTKTCTKQCVDTSVVLAEKCEYVCTYEIPYNVHLTEEERQIVKEYHNKKMEIKNLQKNLYGYDQNWHTAQIELNTAKRHLSGFESKYEEELVTILKQFRNSYHNGIDRPSFDDGKTPLDRIHKEDEEFIKMLSKLDRKDLSEVERAKLYQQRKKRIWELREKKWEKRKEIDKTLAERELKEQQLQQQQQAPQEPLQHDEARVGSIPAWFDELREKAKVFRDSVLGSCTSSCLQYVDDTATQPKKCDMICDNVSNDYGLTVEEKELLKEYKKKQLKYNELKGAEIKIYEEIKGHGNKYKSGYLETKAKAKTAYRQLLDFELKQMKEIMSMKRKYKKNKAVFPVIGTYDTQPKVVGSIYHEIKPVGPAGKYWLNRLKQIEDETIQHQQVKNMDNMPVTKMDCEQLDAIPMEYKDRQVGNEGKLEDKAKFGVSVRKKSRKHRFFKRVKKFCSRLKPFKNSKNKFKFKPEDIKIIPGDNEVEMVHAAPVAAYVDVVNVHENEVDRYIMDDGMGLLDVGNGLIDGYRFDNNEMDDVVTNEMIIMALLVFMICFVCGVIIGAFSGYLWTKRKENNGEIKDGYRSHDLAYCHGIGNDVL